MKGPHPTDRVIAQGRALVSAIEGLTEIDPTGPIERVIAALLLAAYKRRLRAAPYGAHRRNGPGLGGQGDPERVAAHRG